MVTVEEIIFENKKQNKKLKINLEKFLLLEFTRRLKKIVKNHNFIIRLKKNLGYPFGRN